MTEDKILSQQVIQDEPFPDEEIESFNTSTSSSGGVSGATKINSQDLPKKRVAVELLSSVLNTKSMNILGEFDLVDKGGFKVGTFALGESGEISYTSDGITARNKDGLTTFAIDGSDGSAVFRGQIRAGSLVTGEVIVGDNRVIIDGENSRILINDGTNDRILIGYQKDGF